ARGTRKKSCLGSCREIQDHIPDRDPAALFHVAGWREDADRQVLNWKICMTVSGGYPALPFRIMGFVEPCPGFSPSTLLRVEVFLEAVPISTVALLKRFGLGGEGRNPLRKASLEHEGHGAFDLVRLELGVACTFESIHIGPMGQHGIVE